MLKDLIAESIQKKGKFWNKAWSLIEGCSPRSVGCNSCWLADISRRFNKKFITGDHFNGKIEEMHDRLGLPFTRKKPTAYAIWSDLFHEKVSFSFLDEAMHVIYSCKQHYFIAPTKRPEVAVRMLETFKPAQLKNFIILVTMEDQEQINKRWRYAEALADAGWNVGILCEPLLGAVFIPHEKLKKFIWIIAGGESGFHARPCVSSSVRLLRDHAGLAGVSFLFKSWGEHSVTGHNDRLIDGIEYNGVPEI